MKITYIKTGKRLKPKNENKHFEAKQGNENSAKQIRENKISQSEKKNNQEKNIRKLEFNKNPIVLYKCTTINKDIPITIRLKK